VTLHHSWFYLHAMFGGFAFRPDIFFSENVNKISEVGQSDLFLIGDIPLPQDELGTKI